MSAPGSLLEALPPPGQKPSKGAPDTRVLGAYSRSAGGSNNFMLVGGRHLFPSGIPPFRWCLQLPRAKWAYLCGSLSTPSSLIAPAHRLACNLNLHLARSQGCDELSLGLAQGKPDIELRLSSYGAFCTFSHRQCLRLY